METIFLDLLNKKILGIIVLGLFLVTPMSATSFDSRPQWLLAQNDLSLKHWPVDVDYKNGNSWYLGFNAPNGGFISVEPLEFSSSALAIKQVQKANATSLAVQATGELQYAFPNFRFDLSAVSAGYAWYILSPCCVSRGVTFSLGNSYVHIFGSQQTKWPDLVYIFDKQVVKLDNYYNMTPSQTILQEITNYERSYSTQTQAGINTSQLAGIGFIVVLPAIAIVIVAYGPVKQKLKKQK